MKVLPFTKLFIMKDEVVNILLDGMPVARFVAFYLVGLVGMLVLFARQVNQSIKTNPNTPDYFSWKRLFSATSITRLLLSVVVLALAVTHYEELMMRLFNVVESGPINVVGALILGVGIDKIVDGLVDTGTTVAGKALIKKK